MPLLHFTICQVISIWLQPIFKVVLYMTVYRCMSCHCSAYMAVTPDAQLARSTPEGLLCLSTGGCAIMRGSVS